MASPRSAETRKSRTDEKVFRATIDLLRAAGAGAVTVEAVAAASGVAKTTIYRRHTDRIAMLQATLDHYLPRVDTIADPDPRRGLVALARMINTTIDGYIGTSVATMLAAGHDPATEIVRNSVIAPRIQQITNLLDGWKTAGTLRGDLDVNLTVSMIVGAAGVTYARYGAFPADWPERFIDHLWPLLRPPTA